ncbi:MAG: UbiA family prenyltransferase [Vampirovibrionales bacterium]|nr:UbiA family prenyltransferase [Vampirovibrionales bacterium]
MTLDSPSPIPSAQRIPPPTGGIFRRAAERAREYAELVKFEHTVFALPFALAAMLLAAAPGRWPSALTLTWVLLAMAGGRTFAMAANRLIDAQFDAQNPRTSDRAIPAGRVARWEAFALIGASLLAFLIAVWQLPEICQRLAPLALLILAGYSYMKRISSAAHLVLGLALGASAIGGWLAVSGEWSWLALTFGAAVTFWVAGFDIIYACLDEAFDRRVGLHSLPAWLGAATALKLSATFHGLSLALMAAFAALYPHTGAAFWAAIALMGALLAYQHRLVGPGRLERVNEAFFVVNGRISAAIFLAVLLDKLGLAR